MSKSKGKHRSQLVAISEDPSLIGLHHVQNCWIEPTFRSRNNQVVSQPDLVLVNSSGHIVEYKCSDSPRSRKSAVAQLYKAERYVRANLGVNPHHLWYVFDDFRTWEVIGGRIFRDEQSNYFTYDNRFFDVVTLSYF